MTLDGKQWGVPYYLLSVGRVLSTKTVYEAGWAFLSLKTWDEIESQLSAKFSTAGKNCVHDRYKSSFGPLLAIFDYHEHAYPWLSSSISSCWPRVKSPWTDDRVKADFC